jgi:hypothetical protein
MGGDGLEPLVPA